MQKLFLRFLFLCSVASIVFTACSTSSDSKTNSDSTTVAVSQINLSETQITLKPGEKMTLIATVLPDNATNKSVRWTSSDAQVAEVLGGKVTAKAAGQAKIIATSGSIKAECTVTVSASQDAKVSVTLPSPATSAVTPELSADVENLTIKFSSSSDSAEWKVIKTAGLETVTTKTGKSLSVDCSSLEKGSYLVIVAVNGTSNTAAFTVN